MQIKFLRSNSFGLSGTIRNADHHAKNILPLVLALSIKVVEWHFDIWYQGHNVHVFRTKDNRNVILRPFSDSSGYLGIKAELSNQTRCASGHGLLVGILYADKRNGITVEDFSNVIRTISCCSFSETNNQPPQNKIPLDQLDEDAAKMEGEV